MPGNSGLMLYIWSVGLLLCSTLVQDIHGFVSCNYEILQPRLPACPYLHEEQCTAITQLNARDKIHTNVVPAQMKRKRQADLHITWAACHPPVWGCGYETDTRGHSVLFSTFRLQATGSEEKQPVQAQRGCRFRVGPLAG